MIAIIIASFFFGIGYLIQYLEYKQYIEMGYYTIPLTPSNIVLYILGGIIFCILILIFLFLSYLVLRFIFKLKSFN